METGVLLVDVGHAVVAGNQIRITGDPEGAGVRAGGEPPGVACGRSSRLPCAPRPKEATRAVEVPGAEPLRTSSLARRPRS